MKDVDRMMAETGVNNALLELELGIGIGLQRIEDLTDVALDVLSRTIALQTDLEAGQ